MNLFLECATVTDNVDFVSSADKSRLNPLEVSQLQEIANIRKEAKTYSDMEFLIGRVKEGDNFITKKIIFDKYLKSHVDIMKILVQLNVQCPFSYQPIYGAKEITTKGLTVKEQWAVEMIMFRYSLSALYHLGAYSSFMNIIQMTRESYNPKFGGLSTFSQQINVAALYLKEAYAPLARFHGVFSSVEKLLTPASHQFIELRKEVFGAHKLLFEVNLGYLILEKLRLLGEYRKCKEGAKDMVDKLYQVKQVLGQLPQTKQTIVEFIEVGILFFQAYSLVNFFKDNESKKVEEEYGFVKKEFKTMIVENLLVAKHVIEICRDLQSRNYNAEFFEFAKDIATNVFKAEAEKCQMVFSVKTQNAADMYKEAEARTFEHVWETIPTYNLIQDI